MFRVVRASDATLRGWRLLVDPLIHTSRMVEVAASDRVSWKEGGVYGVTVLLPQHHLETS
jgi:hypothetical protein